MELAAAYNPQPAEEDVPMAQILHSTVQQIVPVATLRVADPVAAVPAAAVLPNALETTSPDNGTRVLWRKMTVFGMAASILHSIGKIVGISRTAAAPSKPERAGNVNSPA
jgi:hypothetical protein